MPDINIFVPPAQPVAFATSWAQVERLRAKCIRAHAAYDEALDKARATYPQAPALVRSWLEWQPLPSDHAITCPSVWLKDRLELVLEHIDAAGDKETEQYKRFAGVLAAWREWERACKAIDDQHQVEELLVALEQAEDALAAATKACLTARPATLQELARQMELAVDVEPHAVQKASTSALMAIVQGVIADHAGAAAPTKH